MAKEDSVVRVWLMKVGDRDGISALGVKVDDGMLDILCITADRGGVTVVSSDGGIIFRLVGIVSGFTEGHDSRVIAVGRWGWGLEDDVTIQNAHGWDVSGRAGADKQGKMELVGTMWMTALWGESWRGLGFAEESKGEDRESRAEAVAVAVVRECGLRWEEEEESEGCGGLKR